MPKRMQDGERRQIRVDEDKIWKTLPKVFAIRVDCDTPYVEVSHEGHTFTLTDVAAEALQKKLGKALSILPTSK